MTNSTEFRMPEVIDRGREFESDVGHLWYLWAKHKNRAVHFDTDGVSRFACGIPIPDFQRDFVWTEEQQIRFITNIWRGIGIGSYTHQMANWEGAEGKPKKYSGYLLDGQQRITTIERYWTNHFKINGFYWSELTAKEKRVFMKSRFTHYESELETLEEMKDYYDCLAYGGTPHDLADR